MPKARPFPVARFLFIACYCLFAALLAVFLVRYAISFRRIPLVFSAHPAAIAGAVPEETAEKLDINQASLEELDALPGIGPSLAQAILGYRAQFGAFYYVEEIMDVPGIGEGRFEQIKSFITCIHPAE